MSNSIKRNDGFTLIELLVAMAIGLIVMAAIYSSYRTQQKSYILQEQIANMQQNLRSAMFFMTREIRMAGCDPTNNSGAGITTFTNSSFGFTMDIRSTAPESPYDGDIDDPNENVTYSLYDADGDGDMDLGRDTGGGNQVIAENIDWLDFEYLDQNGNPTATKSGIKSVQITIVAKTGRDDQGYTNNDGQIFNQQGTRAYTAPSDSNHRKVLNTQIRCRNL